MAKKTDKKTKEKISKKMRFSEIIEKNPDAAEFLMEKGMYCIGCPAAMHETLEQGALIHGLNPNNLLKEINEKLKNKKGKINKNSKKYKP